MIPFHNKLDSNHNLSIYGYKTYRNDRGLFLDLKESFTAYIKTKMEDVSQQCLANFELEKYHSYMDEIAISHHDFISTIGRSIPSNTLSMGFIEKLIKIANEDLNSTFDIYKSNIEFRVVRPGMEDNNDLHRDHWFPYFTPLVNIYIPLSSSYFDSAMGLVPFSHEWSDDDVVPTFTYEESVAGKKFLKNGIYYSVPSIESCSKEINLHRPDLTEGDFMLFSPKLIHGGGTNFSQGTRFSLEIRLESLSE